MNQHVTIYYFIISRYERAKDNPIEHGLIKYFNRSKGHGFIINEQREGEEIFVHISE